MIERLHRVIGPALALTSCSSLARVIVLQLTLAPKCVEAGLSSRKRPASNRNATELANYFATTALNSSNARLPPEPPLQISKPANTSVKYQLGSMSGAAAVMNSLMFTLVKF